MIWCSIKSNGIHKKLPFKEEGKVLLCCKLCAGLRKKDIELKNCFSKSESHPSQHYSNKGLAILEYFLVIIFA